MDTQTIQEALRKLVELGMTDDEIGREVDAPQSIITRLRNGTHKTTSFERGSRIMALLKRRAATPAGAA